MVEKSVLVDPELLRAIEPRENAQTLQARLSAFDIPREVLATEDESGVLHIRFLYPDEEREGATSTDGPITIHSGAYSGKILGLDVQVRDHGINRIELLTNQIDQKIQRLKRLNQRLNYQLIRGVLERKGLELVTAEDE